MKTELKQNPWRLKTFSRIESGFQYKHLGNEPMAFPVDGPDRRSTSGNANAGMEAAKAALMPDILSGHPP